MNPDQKEKNKAKNNLMIGAIVGLIIGFGVYTAAGMLSPYSPHKAVSRLISEAEANKKQIADLQAVVNANRAQPSSEDAEADMAAMQSVLLSPEFQRQVATGMMYELGSSSGETVEFTSSDLGVAMMIPADWSEPVVNGTSIRFADANYIANTADLSVLAMDTSTADRSVAAGSGLQIPVWFDVNIDEDRYVLAMQIPVSNGRVLGIQGPDIRFVSAAEIAQFIEMAASVQKIESVDDDQSDDTDV